MLGGAYSDSVFRSNSDFSDLYTSIKDVFDVIEYIYRYSFGVNAIINSIKICFRYKFKVENSLNLKSITKTNLNWVDNGVDAETVPANTFYNIKDVFYWGVQIGKIRIWFKKATLQTLHRLILVVAEAKIDHFLEKT